MGSGNFDLYEHFVDFSSVVLAWIPVRSGRGEPVFEEVAGKGDTGTSDPSLTRAMRKWKTTKLGCRHLDKTKLEKLVNVKNTAHVRTKWLRTYTVPDLTLLFVEDVFERN